MTTLPRCPHLYGHECAAASRAEEAEARCARALDDLQALAAHAEQVRRATGLVPGRVPPGRYALVKIADEAEAPGRER